LGTLPHEDHKKRAPREIKFAIVTVSTSRAREMRVGRPIEDKSGDIAEEIISKYGYKVVFRTVIPDDISAIRGALKKLINSSADIILFIGGTGLTADDVTIEAISPLIEKDMPGFGEIFRFLSYNEIGSSAFLSRALGGIIGKKAIFCLPGSPAAVKLALSKLILEEAGHIVYLLRER